jgi:hypothetical protein
MGCEFAKTSVVIFFSHIAGMRGVGFGLVLPTIYLRFAFNRLAITWSLGLLMVFSLALPSHAHWADLAVADIQIRERDVDLNLTVPTGLLTQFDDDRDRQ